MSSYDGDNYGMSIPGGGVTVFLAGLFVGGLAGATVMLFAAPHSGKVMRRRLELKGIALRDRVVETAEEARQRAEEVVAEARDRTDLITEEARLKIENLQRQGRKIIDGRGRTPIASAPAQNAAHRR